MDGIEEGGLGVRGRSDGSLERERARGGLVGEKAGPTEERVKAVGGGCRGLSVWRRWTSRGGRTIRAQLSVLLGGRLFVRLADQDTQDDAVSLCASVSATAVSELIEIAHREGLHVRESLCEP